MTIEVPPALGLVLAGGLARRMGGGDKALSKIGGVTILERVLARFAPQCRGVIINANGDPARFARFEAAGGGGQRSGLRRTAGRHSGRPRLGGGSSAGNILCRERAGRLPVSARRSRGAPACGRESKPHCRSPARARATGATRLSGLWPVNLRADLRRALVDEDLRKIEVWTARHGIAIAEWADKPVDPFFNVNTPEDLNAAIGIATHNRNA